MRTPLLATALMLGIAASAGAQNRAELQMNADLRMLQEQVSRLQLASNQLVEELRATNKRLDEQAASSQKQVADMRLLIGNLSATLNTVREKLDDNTVRVSQLIEDLPAMRSGLGMIAAQLNTLVGLLHSPVNPTDPNAPPGASDTPLGAVQLPDSPTALFESAMGDYTSNRLPLAIDGFTQYVTDNPDSPRAAEAQFFIGMAYFNDKKHKEALTAFGKVVTDYKDSTEWAPQAMYQQGLTYLELGQRAQAQKIFQQVIKQFPESNSAIMAGQRLTPAR
jgi:tol-pal system protein YbgF